MCVADRWFVQAYHSAAGSPEQVATYQNGARQAWENTWTEVGTVGIFEDSSIIFNSRGYQLFGKTRKSENGRWSTLMKIFLCRGTTACHFCSDYKCTETLTTKKFNQQIIGLSEHTVRRLFFRINFQALERVKTNAKNSCTEVGTVGIFEISGITIESIAISFSVEKARMEIGRRSTLLKIFSFPRNDRLPNQHK